jgi:hypothetical protein
MLLPMAHSSWHCGTFRAPACACLCLLLGGLEAFKLAERYVLLVHLHCCSQFVALVSQSERLILLLLFFLKLRCSLLYRHLSVSCLLQH